MRGAGGCGGPVTTGRAGAAGACGGADATTGDDGGVTGATADGGGTGRGGVTTVGAAGAAGADATAGRSAGGGTTAGRAAGGGAAGVGATGVEAIEDAGGAGGAVGRTGVGATTGLAVTGGATGRAGGVATASFCWVIAFSTSPGRVMCDKSILVLISSSLRRGRTERADGACASDEPRMCCLTFSASCSSRELEWVFFSVTPTSGSVSRIALLLTSSSLARSLIRTLLIRPFFYSALCLGLHCGLTESAFNTRTLSKM